MNINEEKRTYIPFKDRKEKSKQIEYTEKTPLLAPDGTLLAKGWARENVFEYNRNFVKKGIHIYFLTFNFSAIR